MKRWVYTILTIILAIGMAGCSVKESPDIPKTTIPKFTLPESVELSFKPLELTPLTEENPKENWKLVKSFPFGAIDKEAVVLNLYKDINNSEADNANLLKAQLSYKEHTYTLLGEVSGSIFENGLNETRHGLIQKTSYLLQHAYGDKDNQVYLLGGIELFANGPGLVAYLAYDVQNDTWLQFEEWGVPFLEDLDSDNGKELTIQFPGLHMQTPNAKIIRWNNGQLEKSEDFQTALGITSYQPSVINLDRENNMHFAVEVNTSGDSGLIKLAEALYKYENGRLIKVQERQ